MVFLPYFPSGGGLIMRLKYCFQCGKETLLWSEEKRWHCAECNFVLYHNCAAAVAVVITCGEEIMLTRRNQKPAKGRLDLAGGFTDPDETAENTCVRELREELNIEIQPENLRYLMSLPNIYRYKGIDYNTLDLFFEYVVESKFSVNVEKSEISEVIWMKKEEIVLENLAFCSQKRFFREYLKKIG